MRLTGCHNMVMPKVFKTLKKWKLIERVYEELEEVDETRLCCYRVEVRVYGNITIKECKEIVRNFIFSPPRVEETREYKDNIAVMVQVV